MQKNIKSNLWKLLLFQIMQRRHYIPILSIYFLTLPNTYAQQIGIYTAIGYLIGFLLEVPSGYISDKIGHKKALIISSLTLFLSTISFIYATSIIYFIIGSALISSAIAFSSGTREAFLHNTLIQLNREKDYEKIAGKIGGWTSLVASILLIVLPMFTKISIVFPLKINLIFDAFGILFALSFINPKEKKGKEDSSHISLIKQLKKWKNTGFYTLSLFIGIFSAAMFASAPYRSVYLKDLGFPIIFLGIVSSLSRFIWFIIGNNLTKIQKKLNFKSMLIFEIIFFSSSFLLISYFNNPYIIGLIFSISLGYFWARNPIITGYFLKNYCQNKNQKATMLSIKNQISLGIQFILTLFIGYIMTISYKFGYYTITAFMAIFGTIFYLFLKKYLI